MTPDQQSTTVSVVIPAYTLDRWELTRKAVESVRRQTAPVQAVVLCIDNNEELLTRATEEWRSASEVHVVANRHTDHLAGRELHAKAHGEIRRFGAGSARNTGAEHVTSDVVAFMDDDAWAEDDWIQGLLAVYEETDAVAVGGPPVPDYETERPIWYPRNFDWVFGCEYDGLPAETAPVRRLIGANMSVMREALERIGGFHVDEFDDLDMCMRLAAQFGDDRIFYTPSAVVHHYVPAKRVTWRYFCRRCFFVNREKVRAFRGMGAAASMAAERSFVAKTLATQTTKELRRAFRRTPGALRSLGAMFAGIALAAAGHLRGRVEYGWSSVRS